MNKVLISAALVLIILLCSGCVKSTSPAKTNELMPPNQIPAENK